MWAPPYWFVIVCLLVAKSCFSNSALKSGRVRVGESVLTTKEEQSDLNVAAAPISIPTFAQHEGLLSGTKISGIRDNERLFSNGESAEAKESKGRGMGLEVGHALHRKEAERTELEACRTKFVRKAHLH